MTNGQDGIPNEVKVEATVDAVAGWVELDPPRLRIPDGGTVIWIFTGVPSSLRPALLFEGFQPEPGAAMGSSDPWRGPFGELTRQDDAIRGLRAEGLAGEYTYKVCLVGKDPDDPLIRRLECRRVHAGGLVRDPGPP